MRHFKSYSFLSCWLQVYFNCFLFFFISRVSTSFVGSNCQRKQKYENKNYYSILHRQKEYLRSKVENKLPTTHKVFHSLRISIDAAAILMQMRWEKNWRSNCDIFCTNIFFHFDIFKFGEFKCYLFWRSRCTLRASSLFDLRYWKSGLLLSTCMKHDVCKPEHTIGRKFLCRLDGILGCIICHKTHTHIMRGSLFEYVQRFVVILVKYRIALVENLRTFLTLQRRQKHQNIYQFHIIISPQQ